MAISKQHFYEGAALRLLLQRGESLALQSDDSFFRLNDSISLYLKYSTKGRSPWGFTFNPDEVIGLEKKAKRCRVVLGLVCGGDGVAALTMDAFRAIVSTKEPQVAQWVSCERRHGEHYEIAGPGGTLPRKVPPSAWQNLLLDELRR